jgi:hypothetical protein
MGLTVTISISAALWSKQFRLRQLLVNIEIGFAFGTINHFMASGRVSLMGALLIFSFRGQRSRLASKDCGRAYPVEIMFPSRISLVFALLAALLASVPYRTVVLAAAAENVAPSADPQITAALADISAQRIQANIEKLVSFQTRLTLSAQAGFYQGRPRHRRGP